MIKEEKRFSLKKLLSIMLLIFCGLGLGAVTGYISNEYISVYFNNSGVAIELIKFFILFIILFFSIYIQIIIHEAGHLVFGFLSGYEFVSFRIGSVTLVRVDEKWKIKKFTLPGTGGQCLMMPPEVNSDELPYIMYNLGGVLINFITGIISISLVLFVHDMASWLKGGMIIFGIIGIIFAIMNGVPIKVSGIANDGSNLVELLKNRESRRAFYLQLRFNGLLTAGKRPREMKMDEISFKEKDIVKPLNTAIILMQYNYYLDNMEFQKGLEVLESLKPYMNEILGLYRYEIQCERIFLELILKNNKEFVKGIYDKSLEKYIKACKGMIGKTRVMMAYELLYKENKEKAEALYKEGLKVAKTYPIKGEIEMELMIMNYLKSLYKDEVGE